MPITLAQAEQLLREGRRKQLFPQLHATVIAELPDPARRWIVALQARAAGDARDLRAEWRDGVRDFGLLVVQPWMWAMAGDKKWTRFGFDLDFSRGTDVLIRDMMPVPLDQFRVDQVADENYDGEACVRVSLRPRIEGSPVRLKQLEMVVRPELHPAAGTEVFVEEHRGTSGRRARSASPSQGGSHSWSTG